MGAAIKIDEIDEKILRLLIRDARTRLKDIAKDCNITSTSVLNRIKRLKKHGVITGATLFPKIELINLPIMALIGINLDYTEFNEEEILKLIGEKLDLIEPSPSIGKYDLCAIVYAANVIELDKAAYALRKRFKIRKIAVNIWSGIPRFLFENIDLQPKGT